MILILFFSLKVHISEADSEVWYLRSQLEVQHLSCEPSIPHGLLEGLSGSFNVRVCAVNQAGCGESAQCFTVLTGMLSKTPLFP